MKHIVYLSEANLFFSESDVNDLTEFSSLKNETLDITGFLCFSRGRFLQYLEGNDIVIKDLISTIKNDIRHDIIYELEPKISEDRLFSSWGMRYITDKELSTFNLEHCVEQNLLYIKNNFSHKDRCEEFVWKHIETIAKLNKYLK